MHGTTLKIVEEIFFIRLRILSTNEKVVTIVDGTDRLSWNVGKKLPLYTA
jgi:hypothetical protein